MAQLLGIVGGALAAGSDDSGAPGADAIAAAGSGLAKGSGSQPPQQTATPGSSNVFDFGPMLEQKGKEFFSTGQTGLSLQDLGLGNLFGSSNLGSSAGSRPVLPIQGQPFPYQQPLQQFTPYF